MTDTEWTEEKIAPPTEEVVAPRIEAPPRELFPGIPTDILEMGVLETWTLAELRELDPVSYIRYAIVYLGLEDLAAVRAEINRALTARSLD